MQKKVQGVYKNNQQHWVGDGFPVRSLFFYQTLGEQLSPFLLLDYGGPHTFAPHPKPRGVGPHPHRGFETVTIVYDGEVSHRDSTGQGGTIGPGDVQWMTAGSGILHEEFHSQAYTQRGGPFKMAQLWVNLPARHKMTPPRYQAIQAAQIPSVALPDEAGHVRVIAGEYAGHKGPAHTFSPVDVWDVQFNPAKAVELSFPEGRSLALIVFSGAVAVNGGQTLEDAQLAVFQHDGSEVTITAKKPTHALILSGEPLHEPIAGHGPFVMNTQQEIHTAIQDFNSGRFGQIPR